ncbi:hypothetical protein LLS1_28560 [Leifsonia sp. LS1]|nr:hypothetical protein LLS1_28560 [Leifsonia sp. LS1]
MRLQSLVDDVDEVLAQTLGLGVLLRHGSPPRIGCGTVGTIGDNHFMEKCTTECKYAAILEILLTLLGEMEYTN